MAPEIYTNYYVFPRDRCDELENYLKESFSSESSSTRYEIADPDNYLIYLEITRNAALPMSMMEFFASLGGEKLDSRKNLENAMLEHEFMDALSPVDISRIISQ